MTLNGTNIINLQYSGRGEQSKGGRGAHGFGNVDQEALEAEKDPASAAPATEEGAEAEAPAEPVVEAEPEPGMLRDLTSDVCNSTAYFSCTNHLCNLVVSSGPHDGGVPRQESGEQSQRRHVRREEGHSCGRVGPLRPAEEGG